MKKLILLSSIALSLILVAPESRASTVCGSVAGNLISNCGFETGNFNSWTLTAMTFRGRWKPLWRGTAGSVPTAEWDQP